MKAQKNNAWIEIRREAKALRELNPNAKTIQIPMDRAIDIDCMDRLELRKALPNITDKELGVVDRAILIHGAAWLNDQHYTIGGLKVKIATRLEHDCKVLRVY